MVALSEAVNWALKATVPNEVAPLKNCTVPVGVPAPGAVTATVAVRETVVPLAVAVSVVVVLALLTDCERALEVAVRKFTSPLYLAVMLCVPAADGVYGTEAAPEPLMAAV